jgi:hypothetical protein
MSKHAWFVAVKAAAVVYGGARGEIKGVVVGEPVLFNNAARLVNGVLGSDVHGGEDKPRDVARHRKVKWKAETVGDVL